MVVIRRTRERKDEELTEERKIELEREYREYITIYNVLSIVIIAVLMNMQYVQNELINISDEFNEKNSNLYNPNLKDIPVITNWIYILAATIVFFIEQNKHNIAKEECRKKNKSEKFDKTYIDSLSAWLVLIAVSMSDTNLEI